MFARFRTPSTGSLMRLLSLTLVALVAAVGSATFATAQEATPEAGGDGGFFEGVHLEFLGFGETTTLPATPADVVLLRITMDAGASFPSEKDDPSIALVVVESGVVTIRVDTALTVLHPAADGEPGAEDFELIPADQEFTMEEGDSVLFPPNVAGELRNDGTEEVSLLLATLSQSEVTGFGATPEATKAEATPAG